MCYTLCLNKNIIFIRRTFAADRGRVEKMKNVSICESSDANREQTTKWRVRCKEILISKSYRKSVGDFPRGSSMNSKRRWPFFDIYEAGKTREGRRFWSISFRKRIVHFAVGKRFRESVIAIYDWPFHYARVTLRKRFYIHRGCR